MLEGLQSDSGPIHMYKLIHEYMNIFIPHLHGDILCTDPTAFLLQILYFN